MEACILYISSSASINRYFKEQYRILFTFALVLSISIGQTIILASAKYIQSLKQSKISHIKVGNSLLCIHT